MRRHLTKRRMLAVGAGGALLAAVAIEAQRRHLRTIAADPLNERLADPPAGKPLTARSPDGTEIYIETFGEAGAPLVVLAHGWTEQLTYWTLVTERLTARGFRVAAYDLRGHGRSQAAADGDYSIARFGEDLEAVLDAVCAPGERAVVAGHSLGGMSIVGWAEQHDVAARASAAALLFTGVGALLAESTLIPVPWIAAALNRTPVPKHMLTARGGVPKFSTPLSEAMIRYVAFGPRATPAQIAFYERMPLACPPDVRVGAALGITELELHHAVPRLTVPTLVMAGAADRLTPPVHAQRIAEELPALQRLVVLPETGHMGPLERPDEVADALVELAAAAPQPAAAKLG